MFISFFFRKKKKKFVATKQIKWQVDIIHRGSLFKFYHLIDILYSISVNRHIVFDNIIVPFHARQTLCASPEAASKSTVRVNRLR